MSKKKRKPIHEWTPKEWNETVDSVLNDLVYLGEVYRYNYTRMNGRAPHNGVSKGIKRAIDHVFLAMEHTRVVPLQNALLVEIPEDQVPKKLFGLVRQLKEAAGVKK